MLDGANTSIEWQTHPGDVIVMPVGSFEQHGAHLPLDTDSIQCEFFARMVAENLGAALLPTIHIATSLEHSGFRGSFSLKPETLMQIVRDVAEETERQGFKILIIANGHGGNHALVPSAATSIAATDRSRFSSLTFGNFETRPSMKVEPIPD
jgi:creatinine amidohydrolase